MTDDKSLFFEKYKDCAEVAALEKIWKAKETKATSLNILSKKISDLTPE